MRTRIFSANIGSEPAFNLTPVIDIVFQLIIFFAIVCKFIEAENFPVMVPAGCDYAQNEVEPKSASTTVSIIKTDVAMSEFAVGSEKVSASNYGEVTDRVAEMINERLVMLPGDGRTVTLRIDRDVSFAEAQYALAALARSDATDIRLSVFKAEQQNEE